MWALRIKHETRSHSHNTFLTLTYDDDHLPVGLQKHHLQKFWKRLRKHSDYAHTTVKYFACGEYGDRTKRPHYHAAVFNFGLPADSKQWDTENATSETINNIWGMGLVTLSELNTARMAYVAGYVLKKAGYKKQIYIDGETGEQLQPPFRDMSKGIGKSWLTAYGNDLRMGYVQHDQRKLPIPRYYKDRLKKDDPFLANWIKERTDEERAKRPAPDKERNKAAEKIREQQIKKAKRDRN